MRFTTHCEANERRRPKVRQQVEVSGWDGKRKKRARGELWEDERKKHSYLLIESLCQLLRRPLQTVMTTRPWWRLKPSVSDGSTMEASISASAGILNPLMRRYSAKAATVLLVECCVLSDFKASQDRKPYFHNTSCQHSSLHLSVCVSSRFPYFHVFPAVSHPSLCPSCCPALLPVMFIAR